MLQYSTILKFGSVIETIGIYERQCELVRQQLAQIPDFDPETSFLRIDQFNQGYLTANDILDFLDYNRIRANYRDVLNILNEHSNGNNILTYNDFLKIIVPKANDRLKNIILSKRNVISRVDILPNEVENLLANLFEKEIIFNQELNISLHELELCPDYSIQEFFRQLDLSNIGFTDYESIKLFLKDADINLSEDEISSFIRRVNKNNTSRVTYYELKHILEGIYLPRVDSRRIIYQTYSPLSRNTISRRLIKSTYSPLRIQETKRTVRDVPQPIITREIKNSVTNTNPQETQVSKTHVITSEIQSPNKYTDEISFNARKHVNQNVSPKRTFAQETSYGVRSSLRSIPRDTLAQTTIITKEDAKIINPIVNSAASNTEYLHYIKTRKTQSPVRPAVSFISGVGQVEREISNVNKAVNLDLQERASIIDHQKERLSPNRKLNSSLNSTNIEELVNALKNQINIDKVVEKCKIDLAVRNDFNLMDFFRSFDTRHRGGITIQEFESGCRRYGIQPSSNILKLVFNRFSEGKEKLLSFSQFSDIFIPRDPQYALQLDSRPPSNSEIVGPDSFNSETNRIIKELLKIIFEVELVSENLKKKLHSQQNFTLRDAFDAIDSNMTGFISLEELNNILRNYGIFKTYEEVGYIIDRVDKNKDGLITYKEFQKEFTPLSKRTQS